MKITSKLQFDPGKVIKNEDLITFKGGDDSCGYFLCMCYGIGVWWGCYCSVEAMQLDITAHCGGLGGSCQNSGTCMW